MFLPCFKPLCKVKQVWKHLHCSEKWIEQLMIVSYLWTGSEISLLLQVVLQFCYIWIKHKLICLHKETVGFCKLGFCYYIKTSWVNALLYDIQHIHIQCEGQKSLCGGKEWEKYYWKQKNAWAGMQMKSNNVDLQYIQDGGTNHRPCLYLSFKASHIWI